MDRSTEIAISRIYHGSQRNALTTLNQCAKLYGAKEGARAFAEFIFESPQADVSMAQAALHLADEPQPPSQQHPFTVVSRKKSKSRHLMRSGADRTLCGLKKEWHPSKLDSPTCQKCIRKSKQASKSSTWTPYEKTAARAVRKALARYKELGL